MTWMLFIFLQVQSAWLQIPTTVSTRADCDEIGQSIIDISQSTTKNATVFFCIEVIDADIEGL